MTDQSFEAMRRAMVSNQLRTTAVNDPAVVAALAAVPRELFVSAEWAPVAYVDRLVPLGEGRFLNTPMATARLLTEAQPKAGERALVVGAATGYAAAVLARLVGSVVALEESAALAATARANLQDIAGVLVAEGPLAAGWPGDQLYDLILIDGAVEEIPPQMVEQLAPAGRLAAGLIDRGVVRLAIGRRGGNGFGTATFTDAEAAPLPGFAKPAGFQF